MDNSKKKNHIENFISDHDVPKFATLDKSTSISHKHSYSMNKDSKTYFTPQNTSEIFDFSREKKIGNLSNISNFQKERILSPSDLKEWILTKNKIRSNLMEIGSLKNNSDEKKQINLFEANSNSTSLIESNLASKKEETSIKDLTISDDKDTKNPSIGELLPESKENFVRIQNERSKMCNFETEKNSNLLKDFKNIQKPFVANNLNEDESENKTPKSGRNTKLTDLETDFFLLKSSYKKENDTISPFLSKRNSLLLSNANSQTDIQSQNEGEKKKSQVISQKNVRFISQKGKVEECQSAKIRKPISILFFGLIFWVFCLFLTSIFID